MEKLKESEGTSIVEIMVAFVIVMMMTAGIYKCVDIANSQIIRSDIFQSAEEELIVEYYKNKQIKDGCLIFEEASREKRKETEQLFIEVDLSINPYSLGDIAAKNGWRNLEKSTLYMRGILPKEGTYQEGERKRGYED